MAAAASSSCSSAPKWWCSSSSSSPRLLSAARGPSHSKLSIPSSSKVRRVSPIVIKEEEKEGNVHTSRAIRLRSASGVARASYGGGGGGGYNSEPRSGYGGGGGGGGGRSSDANKMFVGNLPWSANDMRLEELFGEYGSVTEARVVKDRETGRSRGFGFVSMSSTEEMNAAIQALDGYDLDGRPIRVNQAESRF